MWEQPWLRSSTQGLGGRGMVLLSPAEVPAYLEGEEAAYWVWRWGGTPCWRHVRPPALWKRLLWRVWPALPRDRELVALASGQRAAGTGGYTRALIQAAPQLVPGRLTREALVRGELPSPINPLSGCMFHPRYSIVVARCGGAAGAGGARG